MENGTLISPSRVPTLGAGLEGVVGRSRPKRLAELAGLFPKDSVWRWKRRAKRGEQFPTESLLGTSFEVGEMSIRYCYDMDCC
jgi:hypothetical protein